MSQAEAFRSQGGFYENLGLDKNYPGEFFDPLGLADDPEVFAGAFWPLPHARHL